MNAVKREKIHKILDAVIDRNETGNASFFEFAGHVNLVCVQLYDGEWKKNKDNEFLEAFVYGRHKDADMLDAILEALC